jgi:hypothetical protein
MRLAAAPHEKRGQARIHRENGARGDQRSHLSQGCAQPDEENRIGGHVTDNPGCVWPELPCKDLGKRKDNEFRNGPEAR